MSEAEKKQKAATTTTEPLADKLVYQPPVLTQYGTVEELADTGVIGLNGSVPSM